MRTRRLYFTLMEMLVALGIMLSATAVIGISIFKAIEEQRFKAEVSRVVDQLRLAQDLMLMFNLDIIVKFERELDGKEMMMKLQTKDLLHPSWARFIEREPLHLKKVKHVLWNDAPMAQELKLAFTSRSLLMSKGVLRLSETADHNANWTRDIILQGYPAQIKAQLPVENPFKKEPEEREYIERLIEVTRPEIEEIKKNDSTNEQEPTHRRTKKGNSP